MTKDTSIFLKAFMKNFRKTGSIMPSSVYLAKKLVAPLLFKPEMIIVELGAGTGSITKYLLSVLPNDVRLFSIELNEVLSDHLDLLIKDPRFTLIRGDASKLSQHLEKYNIKKADHIISGLPLGSLSVESRESIYKEIKKCLEPNGVYTQFQYLMANLLGIKKHFKVENISFEWRNIPPAFIYTCRIK